MYNVLAALEQWSLKQMLQDFFNNSTLPAVFQQGDSDAVILGL